MLLTPRDSLPLYVPERYDERVHDFVTVAGGGAGGSVLATNILRKTLDPTTWIVGNNVLATIAGGVVRIDSLVFRVLTGLVSATGTLDIQLHGISLLTAPLPQGNLLINELIARGPGAASGADRLNALAADLAGAGSASNQGGQFGFSGFTAPNIRAVVATAVFTAGSLEMDLVWAPLTSGATVT